MIKTCHTVQAVAITCLLALSWTSGAQAGPRDTIIAGFASQAGTSLSADRGKAFFYGTHTGGKPELTSCTVCHTQNLHATGKTRVGKAIKPMAVSSTPSRFTDAAKVEKWFRRNCKSVVGRECTAQEKGDIITYLASI